MKKYVEVLSDQSALITRSLSIILEKYHQALDRQDYFTIALSGGNTPKPLYEALAKQALSWDKIHVFWGDERYVSPDHPDSNQRMARMAWLDHVPIPETNVHPMPTAAADPTQDAQTHEQDLRQFFDLETGEMPTFDVILLGMGDDGHTASLFPHTDSLTVSDRLITVGNKGNQPRLTFSAPLINHARCVIFLVVGENKRTALAAIFAPTGDEKTYPSRLIQPQGELWWLLDQAAGAELKTDP